MTRDPKKGLGYLDRSSVAGLPRTFRMSMAHARDRMRYARVGKEIRDGTKANWQESWTKLNEAVGQYRRWGG